MPPRVRTPLALPGHQCVNAMSQIPHSIDEPDNDQDFQTVLNWLRAHPLERLLTSAVNDAVEYVLDGARTWRFDLNGADVDSDERRTVGTKLQYRVLASLKLVKEPPLDTMIAGIPVELKGTVDHRG